MTYIRGPLGAEIGIHSINPDDVNPDGVTPAPDAHAHYHVVAHQYCGCTHIAGEKRAAEHCNAATQQGDCDNEWIYGWGTWGSISGAEYDEPAVLRTPAQAKQLADYLVHAGTTDPHIGPKLQHRWVSDFPFTEVTPDTIWILNCYDENCVFDFMLENSAEDMGGKPYWTARESA